MLAATRSPTWLLGEGPVQVWAVNEPWPYACAVMVTPSLAVILLASRLAGTTREGAEIRWAMKQIAMVPSGESMYAQRNRR